MLFELINKMGYSDEQLPCRVAAGAELPAEGAADSWLQKAKPVGAPVRVGRARKKTSAQPSQPSSPRKIYRTVH